MKSKQGHVSMQAEAAESFLDGSAVRAAWVAAGRGDEAALQLKGTPAAALAAFRNVAHLLDAVNQPLTPKQRFSPASLNSGCGEELLFGAAHCTEKEAEWVDLNSGMMGAIGLGRPHPMSQTEELRKPAVLPPLQLPRLAPVRLRSTSAISDSTSSGMHTPVHLARLGGPPPPPPPPPRLKRFRSR